MKNEIAIAAHILQNQTVESVATKYGWRAVKQDNKYFLHATNGNHVATISIKGKKYTITGALGNKLMSGNVNVAIATERLLTECYYAKPVSDYGVRQEQIIKPVLTLLLACFLLTGCNSFGAHKAAFTAHEEREFSHYTQKYADYLSIKYEMPEDDAFTVSAWLRGADTVRSEVILRYQAEIDSEIQDNE